MAKSLGIHLTGRIATGVVEETGACPLLFHFPENLEDTDSLLDMPLDGLIDLVEYIKTLDSNYRPQQTLGTSQSDLAAPTASGMEKQ